MDKFLGVHETDELDGVGSDEASVPGVRCVVPYPAVLGEGPVWSERDASLYWVDIHRPAVHRWCAASGAHTERRLEEPASIAVPCASGGLLVATPRGLMRLGSGDGSLSLLSHPESGRPGNRYNDGRCDRLGRLWIGSMDRTAAPQQGSLFRVQGDGTATRMISGFTLPNGLGWSPDDRRMYVTETAAGTIYEYDFDLASGTIENRRPFIALDPARGKPDGLTVDADGCLWVALWDGWEVVRFSPQGREIQRVAVPVPRPTSCCFGGDGLTTLFITSARLRLDEQSLVEAPLSGAVFAVEVPGARGLPEAVFAA